VEDLAKTVPFYRDVLGLKLSTGAGNADPSKAAPTALDPENSKFTGTEGAKFRAVTFRIPNANFGMELTEFTGPERKSVRPNLQDPGAATLVLIVRDMDAMFAKLKAAGTQVVTIGGAPVNPTGTANQFREVLVRDPDGFFIELQRPDPFPPALTAFPGDILGASVQFTVEDTAKSVAFFTATLGYQARPAGPMATNKVVTDLIGLPGAEWRITHGNIPGTTLDISLIEYKGVERKAMNSRAADPGTPEFTVVVRDIDASVDKWKASGGSVMSTGGKAIKRANGTGNVFVRDINGMLFELIQRAGQ
jgi:catechol 2,3-dioxygenase-like lactoylglutathione lyase family enzyme